MNIQTKASLKKEYLAFFRTKKFLILALVIIGLAIFNPLLVVGLGSLMDSMSSIYESYGTDVSGLTEMLGSSVSSGVVQAVSGIAQTGLIVFLLLINSNAGGEQKKRSIMIPRSSGLRSFSYIFPKFVVYPLSAFVLAIAATFSAWGISSLVFRENDVSPLGVLLGGALVGVSLMFYVCAHITIGTATGRAGMSAAICIVSSLLLSNIFAIFGSEFAYNPFTLNILASMVISREELHAASVVELGITAIIAFVVMVILFFLALFAQNARKTDNSGDEIRI